MPFAVTKWGYSPDPRHPAFAPTGFAFGGLPPWRWTMKTTGALAPYLALNAGVTWERSSDAINTAAYLPLVPIPDVTGPFLSCLGSNPPQATVSMEWFVGFFTTGDAEATEGFINELFPNALQKRSFTMTNVNGGTPFFPNPLVITPHKWNAA